MPQAVDCDPQAVTGVCVRMRARQDVFSNRGNILAKFRIQKHQDVLRLPLSEA